MSMPKDPVLLLSYVNTQLRDHYSSLHELCEDKDIDEEELKASLKRIDYVYDPDTNSFK